MTRATTDALCDHTTYLPPPFGSSPAGVALAAEERSLAAALSPPPTGMSPFWLLVILASVPAVTTSFWWLGTRFLESSLSFLEYLEFGVLLAAVVAGGYQLYFWVQRNGRGESARCLEISADRLIPFRPRWIWLYSLLYYVMLGLTVVSVESLADGVHLIFGGLMLLAAATCIFYFFPTEVPPSYRDYEATSLSTRYMKFVQGMDNERNAFPSMHCAVATYVGLALVDLPGFGPWLGYGFIAALTVSCLLVKQHVIIDTLAGIALGWAVFTGNEWLAGVWQ